jgi:hypothetical protein
MFDSDPRLNSLPNQQSAIIFNPGTIATLSR